MTADEVTTAAELDALPVGSRVRDRFGDVGQHYEQGVWRYPETSDLTSRYVAGHFSTFVVLYRPDRPAPQVGREALASQVREFAAECRWNAEQNGGTKRPGWLHIAGRLDDLLLAAQGDAAPATQPVTVTAEQVGVLWRKTGVVEVDDPNGKRFGKVVLSLNEHSHVMEFVAALGIEVTR